MRGVVAFMLAAAWALVSLPAVAQEAEVSIPAPVLVIDPERVYAESRRGQSVRSELDAAAAALQNENDRIVNDLIAEEQDLAARRPNMDPAAFREEADSFDEKAQDIRRARDAKERELTRIATEARAQFFAELRPIVGQLLIDKGGVAVLDSRSVYLVLRSADVTEDVIERLDALDAEADTAPPDE